MENLKTSERTYYNVFVYSDDLLKKYSAIEANIWNKLKEKNLPFVNAPSKASKLNEENQKKLPGYKSVIYLPFLKNYETLENGKTTDKLDTKSLLEIFKDSMEKLKELHRSGICHCDIHGRNIMINENLDIKFIDFESMIIDFYVPKEPLFLLNSNLNSEEIIKKAKNKDKIDMLKIFIWYLQNGTFNNQLFGEISSIENLEFDKSIKKELENVLFTLQGVKDDYYFLDIIDYLQKEGYESPKILARNK